MTLVKLLKSIKLIYRICDVFKEVFFSRKIILGSGNIALEKQNQINLCLVKIKNFTQLTY